MSRNQTRGIWLMVAAVFSFASQDAFARHLAGTYNTLMIVMIRYWIFAVFVMILALRRPEGIRAAVTSHHLPAHILRAVLLIAEICIIVWAYTMLGLINGTAVFSVCPLMIVALSVPLLGERLTRARLVALALAAVGVLIILRPGAEVFSWPALLPLLSAFLFALYSILTRLTTREEPSFAAFFWPPLVGAGLMSVIGLPAWQPMAALDWLFVLIYGLISVLSNWLLQKTYESAEASVVQPFAYLQIVFSTVIGISIYGEVLHPAVAIGSGIVIAAGLLAWAASRPAKADLPG